MSILFMLTIVIPILVCFIGFVLLGVGWRGRLLNKHPVCRKCKFDLSGYSKDDLHRLEDNNNIELIKCPECGSVVGAAGTIQIGQRHKRYPFIFSGSVLFVLSAAVLGIQIFVAAQQINTYKYKPVWWLIAEMQSPDTVSVDAAFGELMSRLQANKLSRSDINNVVNQVLELQADQSFKWNPVLGDFIEDAWLENYLSSEQRNQYAQNAYDIELVHRDKYLETDDWELRLKIAGWRMGNDDRMTVFIKRTEFTLDGADINMPKYNRTSFVSSSGSIATGISASFCLTHDIGKHIINTRWQAYVSISVQADNTDTMQREGYVYIPSELDAGFEFALEAQVEIVGEGTELVREDYDPSKAEEIKSGITVNKFSTYENNGLQFVEGYIDVAGNSYNLAFDVYLRDSFNNEWLVGRLVTPENNSDITLVKKCESEVVGFIAGMADVVLRSNPEAARSDNSITEIWGGEIVFEDIMIRGKGMPIVKVLEDMSLTHEMKSCITVLELQLYKYHGLPMVSGSVSIKNPRVNVAFDIFLRDQYQKEWNVGQIAMEAVNVDNPLIGSYHYTRGFNGNANGLNAGLVDVILRSSPEAAQMDSNINVMEIWGGEIVFEDVELGN